mmetsp:Transcript_43958/g.72660  ORF Transcript_43958/g.72660 Transcript_43958/m.72660 type:complete len:138 (+) Transcript_43958:151-564(+)
MTTRPIYAPPPPASGSYQSYSQPHQPTTVYSASTAIITRTSPHLNGDIKSASFSPHIPSTKRPRKKKSTSTQHSHGHGAPIMAARTHHQNHAAFNTNLSKSQSKHLRHSNPLTTQSRMSPSQQQQQQQSQSVAFRHH